MDDDDKMRTHFSTVLPFYNACRVFEYHAYHTIDDAPQNLNDYICSKTDIELTFIISIILKMISLGIEMMRMSEMLSQLRDQLQRKVVAIDYFPDHGHEIPPKCRTFEMQNLFPILIHLYDCDGFFFFITLSIKSRRVFSSLFVFVPPS